MAVSVCLGELDLPTATARSNHMFSNYQIWNGQARLGLTGLRARKCPQGKKLTQSQWSFC
jgi:hypothetical protein